MSKCEDYKINCSDCPIKDICHTHEQYDVGNILLEVYDSGVKQGREDAFKDTELFREIFLEELVQQSCDREEAIMYRNICAMVWSKFLEQLKEKNNE